MEILLSVVKCTLVGVTDVTVAFLAVAMFHCVFSSQFAGRLTLLSMRILSPAWNGVVVVVFSGLGCGCCCCVCCL